MTKSFNGSVFIEKIVIKKLLCSTIYRLWNFLKGYFVLLMDYLKNNRTLCPNNGLV